MVCRHKRAQARRGIVSFKKECNCPGVWQMDPLEAPHRKPKIEQALRQGKIYSETGWGLAYFEHFY